MYLAIELKKKEAITHLCFLGANNNLVFEILFRVRLRVEIVLGPFVTRFLFVLGLPRVQLIVDSPALDEIVVGALLLHNAISEHASQFAFARIDVRTRQKSVPIIFFPPVSISRKFPVRICLTHCPIVSSSTV